MIRRRVIEVVSRAIGEPIVSAAEHLAEVAGLEAEIKEWETENAQLRDQLGEETHRHVEMRNRLYDALQVPVGFRHADDVMPLHAAEQTMGALMKIRTALDLAPDDTTPTEIVIGRLKERSATSALMRQYLERAVRELTPVAGRALEEDLKKEGLL